MGRDDFAALRAGCSKVGDELVRPEKRIHPEIISLSDGLEPFVGGFGRRVPAERGRGWWGGEGGGVERGREEEAGRRDRVRSKVHSLKFFVFQILMRAISL